MAGNTHPLPTPPPSPRPTPPAAYPLPSTAHNTQTCTLSPFTCRCRWMRRCGRRRRQNGPAAAAWPPRGARAAPCLREGRRQAGARARRRCAEFVRVHVPGGAGACVQFFQTGVSWLPPPLLVGCFDSVNQERRRVPGLPAVGCQTKRTHMGTHALRAHCGCTLKLVAGRRAPLHSRAPVCAALSPATASEALRVSCPRAALASSVAAWSAAPGAPGAVL